MEKDLFGWVLQIPQTISNIADWLNTPLQYINMSPLGLLGIAGGSALLVIIGVHIVKLFL